MPAAAPRETAEAAPAVAVTGAALSLIALRRLLCAVAAAFSLAGFAGWISGSETLTSVVPGLVSMKVNTALLLLALAFAQYPVGRDGRRKTGLRLLRRGCEIVAVALGIATLGEYAFGVQLGIDEWWFTDQRTAPAAYPGRPSPATMAAVVALGAASLVLGCRPRWCAAAGHWMAAPGAAIAALGLVGYAYGAERLYTFGPYITVALGTVVSLCALAASILLDRCRESWAKVLIGRPAACAVFGRLLPASFVLPVATGLLVQTGVRVGLYSPTFGISIFAVLTVGAFIALSWETASVASRVEGALQRSNAGLLAARLRAEEATRAKSLFLAGMSHELRTPLHAILGYAELLATEGDLRAPQIARIRSMLATGRHLLETINSVLAMSEIEAGRAALNPTVVSLRQLGADVIDLVRPDAEAKGLAIVVECAPGLPHTIVADATRLRQILVNLLGNAVKFTDRGSITLRLRKAVPEDAAAGVLPPVAGSGAPGHIVIEVADTGRGIPPARRDALFRDFERLGLERDARIEGAGLGLAIAARLATLMGGHIAYAENPGGGSIFATSLPIERRENTRVASALPPSLAQAAPESTAGSVPCRVLLVDDVEMNREIAAAFLRSAGHAVTVAETGAAAVREAARQDFDVVLMDVRMGDMDGLEATRHIRALGGRCGSVPIVAMTAHVFADQIEACGRAGMDFHLPKPFDKAALLAAIDSALEWRDTRALAQTASDRVASNADVPVIDAARLASIAAYLPPDGLDRYLSRLAAGIEAMLAMLRALDRAAPGSPELADAVHSLGGKAGMLGFARLASAAGRFENLARSGKPLPAAPFDTLLAVLEASLAEARQRLETRAVGLTG